MIERIKTTIRYHRLKQFIKRHERALMPAMLLSGVAVDAITFANININGAFTVLGVHVIILGYAIARSHLAPQSAIMRYIHAIAPLAIQFSLGALLSASLIFYWYSATVAVSWPILGIIAVLMVSNELFREKLLRPTVQIAAYFFAVFATLTIVLPVVFNSIAAWTFFASGIAALALMLAYTNLTARHIPNIADARPAIYRAMLILFLAMNTLFALNIIPPIPLSLRDAGVYHSVTRSNGAYRLEEESHTWLQALIPGQTIHPTATSGLYVFSAIYAPTDLATTMYHQWDYYDERTKKWIPKDRLGFSIRGGRRNGYRGFTQKSRLAEGAWRVTIQTHDGRALGRIQFNVTHAPQKPTTHSITR